MTLFGLMSYWMVHLVSSHGGEVDRLAGDSRLGIDQIRIAVNVTTRPVTSH